MDVENMNDSKELNWQYPDGTNHDVTMESPAPKGRRSLSPRKRAFRDLSEDDNLPTDETDGSKRKRHKLHRKQEEYPTACTANVPWKLETGCDGGALLVEEKQIIIGLIDGRVIFCDLEGHVTSQIQLSRPIGALLRHAGRLYAWCHAKKGYEKWKGALVDLSFDSPLVLFDVEGFGDHCRHADMVDGCLAVSDNNGNVGLFGCDGVAIWKNEQPTLGSGDFLKADESGIYVAHKKVVRCYKLEDGEVLWEFRCPAGRQSNISKGYQNKESIYIESKGSVLQLSKDKGCLEKEFMPYRHEGSGVCSGNGMLVTGNNPTIVFDEESGEETHRLLFPIKMESSMYQFPGNRKLYAVWDQLYCIDLTEEGLQKAVDGKYSRTFIRKLPAAPAEPELPTLGTICKESLKAMDGVIVTCSVPETADSEVKVTVSSEGHNADWPVMFPRDLRVAGKQFYVEGITASELGQFYRVSGKLISKYTEEMTPPDSTDNKTEETSESRYLTTMSVSLVNEPPKQEQN